MIRKGIKADGKEWRYGYDIYDRLTSAGLYASAGKHFSLRAAAPPTPRAFARRKITYGIFRTIR